MKNIWLNILAFVAFLAIEIVAVSFMSVYSAGSAAMALLGVLALVIGGIYTAPAWQRHREHPSLISFSFATFHPFLFFSPWFPGVTASR